MLIYLIFKFFFFFISKCYTVFLFFHSFCTKEHAITSLAITVFRCHTQAQVQTPHTY